METESVNLGAFFSLATAMDWLAPHSPVGVLRYLKAVQDVYNRFIVFLLDIFFWAEEKKTHITY